MTQHKAGGCFSSPVLLSIPKSSTSHVCIRVTSQIPGYIVEHIKSSRRGLVPLLLVAPPACSFAAKFPYAGVRITGKTPRRSALGFFDRRLCFFIFSISGKMHYLCILYNIILLLFFTFFSPVFTLLQTIIAIFLTQRPQFLLVTVPPFH